MSAGELLFGAAAGSVERCRRRARFAPNSISIRRAVARIGPTLARLQRAEPPSPPTDGRTALSLMSGPLSVGFRRRSGPRCAR